MEQFNEHKTIVQTKEERLAEGKPVGHDVAYQAMGGITGFSSLMDGYMRLDPRFFYCLSMVLLTFKASNFLVVEARQLKKC